MKKLILGLLVFGFTSIIYAQTIELSEVEISKKYQYLDAVDKTASAKPVKLLTSTAANYDIKSSDIYDYECDNQEVYFEIPDGKILAVYDDNGKIIRTVEKYKNVRLPSEVLQAISKQYPKAVVVEDVYLVNYHCDKGTKHIYKVKIKDQDKLVSIKTDEKGNFM